MATFILWPIGDPAKLNFGFFAFDAVTAQTHNRSLTMMKHPAEKGIMVTDHLKNEPDTLEISGIITNTVIAIGAPLRYDKDRAEQVDASIRNLFVLKTPVLVVSSLLVYEDMIIKNYRVDRAPGKTGGIFCDISLEQIRIVESQTAAAPEIKKRKIAGRKPTKAASTKTEEKASASLSKVFFGG